MSAVPSGTHLGAYGLRLVGADLATAKNLLVPAEGSWPEIELERRAGGPFPRDVDRVSPTEARLQLESGGMVEIDLPGRRATITTPTRIAVNELIHPYLAPIAAVLAYWLDRESFHAGAFRSNGKVWGVMGDRGAGKSSTLGWLAQQGLPIVCDDMLVLEGRNAFAGPRSVDLRKEAAEMLGTGEAIGVVGVRERWRLTVPQIDGELRLGGLIFLSWGDRLSATALRPVERLSRLAAQRGIRIPPKAPEALIALAELPSWEISRPRGRDSLGAAGERLLELVAS